MRHALWKRLLSYFVEISLETTSSDSNPYLEVLLVKGRHQLTTEDAIYSFDDKYENFNYAFRHIDWEAISGNRVLVLGLGLGSVILLLEKHFGKRFDYTAIEIDDEICRLCHTYTLQYLDSYVEVIPVEAMSFLAIHEEKYDIVIMDIFQSAEIPAAFQTTKFLRRLSDLLQEQGMLLFNRMNISDTDIKANQAFNSNMRTVFPNMAELKTKTNVVLVNDKAFTL